VASRARATGASGIRAASTSGASTPSDARSAASRVGAAKPSSRSVQNACASPSSRARSQEMKSWNRPGRSSSGSRPSASAA
jgi:hypothetical protein